MMFAPEAKNDSIPRCGRMFKARSRLDSPTGNRGLGSRETAENRVWRIGRHRLWRPHQAVPRRCRSGQAELLSSTAYQADFVPAELQHQRRRQLYDRGRAGARCPRARFLAQSRRHANVVLKTNKSTPVKVSNVASADVGYAPRLGIVGMNYQDEVVEGIVLMRKHENTLKTSDGVEAVLRR